ncbi:CDP-glycerol glycerophosphotransferase family protein, partial [Staphylococcus pseudintermedius]|uniref:CDP-glycerol glycerophosphotransferase family protein n=1 Tax=Staphylococcus pseudintermedius TaxID=283734 RepID=UPI0036F265A2
VYTDWSFILDYVQYAEHFIRVINFPFYFKGEVYDPFETNTLSEQNFDFLFEDYAKSFIDALSRVKNKQTRTFIKQRMLNTLHNDFSPNLRETAQRFATHQDALAQVVRHLGVDILKEHKILFTLETFALAFRKIGWASSINRLRFVTRHAKRVALRQKGKELSKYFLTDKDENVNNKTVVFESFGGKNYSDSPKYIYEYMKDHYPELNYRWVFTNPETNRVPGEALKVKKNSAAYYQAYSEAKVWVSNARLP